MIVFPVLTQFLSHSASKMSRAILLLALFGCVLAEEDFNYRLPGNIRPSRYELFMRMVLDANQDGFSLFSAPGNVTITLTCVNATDVITLNEQYITILEGGVAVTDVTNASNPRPVSIASHSYKPALHFYNIQLNSSLEVNRTYSLFVPFVSKILTNDTLGLYRGYYTDELAGNVTKNMSTTFFQPFGGRRMFPCFDEPDMKAVFQISIARLKKYHTLANTDLRQTAADNEHPAWEWDHFNPTVPMSTYIICVIVSDFASETADPSIFPRIPVKVWGTPAAIKAGGGVFAAEMGAKLLAWYENYTSIPYALAKMDSIAIPQFAAGAMENWGLNTYRDAYLIYKPGDSEASKIGVAETLAHELSHQWFGNLATCQWWDQMWLNEGLATYFTYKSLVFVAPEFNTEYRYIVRHHQNSLRFDSDANKSHAVVIPTAGFNFFDGTSMEKGGSLTRMMDYLFTYPILKDAMRTYLQRHAYKGAVQDDLFEALQDSLETAGKLDFLPPGISVKQVMDTWTLQTGYPLVRVSRRNNTLALSQENIILEQPNHTWWIPITIVTADEPVFTDHAADLWIAPNQLSTTVNLSSNSSSGWILLNTDGAGFYRVLYDDELNDLIDAELRENPNAFTNFTRMMIVDDRLNLGIAGFLPLEKAIEVTNYLPKEKSPGVLIGAVSSIKYVLKNLSNHPKANLIKGTLVNLLERLLDSIEGDSQLMNAPILRDELMFVLCKMESSRCDSVTKLQ